MSLPYVIMVFVTVQRLAELVIADRNTRLLKAQGAIEYGASHYPVMIVLHGAWLVTLWASIGWAGVGGRPVNLALLGVFAVLQALRIWVLVTLGSRWTTRIIVLRGLPLVTGGPFRILRHPNYCVVIGEIAVLPLVFGLAWVSIVFSVLNAAMLRVRIADENRALYDDRKLL